MKHLLTMLFLINLCLTACAPPMEPKPSDPQPPIGEIPTRPGPDTPDCTGADCPQPVETPASTYSPREGDDSLTRGQVYDLQAAITMLESFPPQVMLRLTGSLPTPCHQLRVRAADPDDKRRIYVEVYSLVDANTICVQALAPFEAAVPLGSPPGGKYEVIVNGSVIGEFIMP